MEFIVDEYYVWDGPKEIERSPELIWFNVYMIEWFDRKPRKCIRLRNSGHVAAFEGIHQDHNSECWDYLPSIKYFKKFVQRIQEEFEI